MDLAVRGAIDQRIAGLELNGAITWGRRGNWATAKIAVRNKIGSRLTLVIQVNALAPHRPVALIHDAGPSPNCAYRLCARGMHVNRRSDRRQWLPGSHLHQWMPEYGDSHAVDPPTPPWPPQGWDEKSTHAPPAQLLAVVESFCQIVGLPFDRSAAWNEPDLSPQPSMLPDGDEIP